MRLTHWLRLFAARLGRSGQRWKLPRVRGAALDRRPSGLSYERLEQRVLLAAPHPFDLSTLTGTNGFRLEGAATGDYSGVSVGSAGDVNGDGFEDLVIGAFLADPGGKNYAGSTYVVFGKATGFAAAIDLATLDGTNGFRLDGVAADDWSGFSVSGAGDVNGDGFADLAIGAMKADPGAKDAAGSTYIVFGKAIGFASAIELATLNGTNGFRLDGATALDRSGGSVGAAGDVNGDGYTDIIIGAANADPGANSYAGSTYILFGKASGFAATIDLATLDGTYGFRLDGVTEGEHSGYSVSAAGDVNGDGFADLFIGAPTADPGFRSNAGATYVVFGKATGFAAAIDLETLDGTNGFRIDGVMSSAQFGRAIGAAGDVNGDGFSDLLIGAWIGNYEAGLTCVVFGKGSGFAATLDLATLNGTNGFRLEGIDAGDRSAFSVSGAGDVNGDGFDDLLVGAYGGDPGGDSSAGETYVVFGQATGFAGVINLATLSGTNGFRLDGIDVSDQSGRSVSGAGDVNGDGFDDLLVGARFGDPGSPARTNAGETYVVFGGNFTGGTETQVGGGGSQTLTANQGTGNRDVLIGGLGHDTLISDGGADVLIGGEGDDTLQMVDVDFSGTRRLNGGRGTDTLLLTGSGLHLDLTSIRDNRIQDIEIIDITGSGNNTLTLSQREVLNLSDHSNTLLVRRNAGDVVNIADLVNWTEGASENIGGTNFSVYTLGAATLKVANTAPTAVDDVNSTLDDNPVSGNVLTDGTDDSDPEGDALTVTQFTVAGDVTVYNAGQTAMIAGVGTLVIGTNGSYTFTPVLNFSGPVPVATYTLSDGALTDTATLTLTVTAENDAPVAVDDINSTLEENPVSGNVLTDGTDDSDVEGSPLSVTQFTVAGDVTTYTAGQTAIIAGVGTLVIDANGAYTFTPVLNYNGPVPVATYTITDGALTDTATLTLNVTPQNDAPTAQDDTLAGVSEDAGATGVGNVLANNGNGADSDVDVGQILSVIAQTNTAGTNGGLFTVNAAGAVTFNPNGAFHDLAVGQTRTTSFTYTVSDGNGGSDTAVASVTVTGANDAPVAIANVNSTTESGAVNGNVLTDGTADRDIDNAANTLMVSAVNGVGASVGTQITLASGALLTVHANGSYTYNPNGAFETVNFGSSTTDSFQYTVKDPGGLTSTATVTITVNSVNDGFTYSGSSVAITGTNASDTFQVDLATGVVTRNGVAHTLPAGINSVSIDGLGGSDTLTLLGTSGAEVVRLLPLQGFLDSSSVGVTGSATSIETINYFGNGGADRATLTGSTGNDKFVGRSTQSFMEGAGAAYTNTVVGVATVVANSPSGGSDTAYLFDTTVANTFTASGTTASISGTGVKANNFESVIGYASGGTDTANLTGSAVKDTLLAAHAITTLAGAGITLGAVGWEQLSANGAGGTDVARLFGRAGVDTFLAGPTSASLSGTGYQFTATGFETVIAAAAGPGDRATLQDSTGNDQFLGQGNTGTLTTPTNSFAAVGFSQITIRGTNGGTNKRTLKTPPALGFTLLQQGTWV